MYTHTHTQSLAHTHTHNIHLYIYTSIYPSLYISVYIHTHIHIHIRMASRVWWSLSTACSCAQHNDARLPLSRKPRVPPPRTTSVFSLLGAKSLVVSAYATAYATACAPPHATCCILFRMLPVVVGRQSVWCLPAARSYAHAASRYLAYVPHTPPHTLPQGPG